MEENLDKCDTWWRSQLCSDVWRDNRWGERFDIMCEIKEETSCRQKFNFKSECFDFQTLLSLIFFFNDLLFSWSHSFFVCRKRLMLTASPQSPSVTWSGWSNWARGTASTCPERLKRCSCCFLILTCIHPGRLQRAKSTSALTPPPTPSSVHAAKSNISAQSFIWERKSYPDLNSKYPPKFTAEGTQKYLDWTPKLSEKLTLILDSMH